MTSPDVVLVVHAAATWFMAGVIWIIQVVHYPLYDHADRARIESMIAAHTSRIAWVVGPLMTLELASAAWLLARPPAGTSAAAWLIGLLLLVPIWLSTMLVQGPAHGRLAHGFDEAVHRRLVRSNWIRTIAWTLRALLVGALLLGR